MGEASRMTMCRQCGTLNRTVGGRRGARCGRCRALLEPPAGGGGGGAATATQPARAKPIDVTPATFRREVLESDMPVLLDCWAAWCGPCHMLAPTLAAIAAEQAGRLKVCKLNVDEAPELARELQVMALPTLIAFRRGLPLGRQMGVQSAERLSAWLRDLGVI